ncbi:MAG: glycine cleavage system protein H [Mycobacterium sp.]
MTTITTNRVPNDRRYTDIHSWLALAPDERPGNHPLRVGITEIAVEGVRVISVELPRVHTAIEAGEPCALIWTAPLSAMPVYAPITGRVTVVNPTVRDDPGIVARDPFDTGWLFAVLPTNTSSTYDLLTASDYENYLNGAVYPSSSHK